MNSPSLLLLIRALDTGGAQRQLVELAIGLHRAGWDVSVATFYPGGPLECVLRTVGIRTICLEKRGRWDVLPFLWRLVRLIRRERPDFVKGYLVMSNLLLSSVRPFIGRTRVVWGVAASDMDLGFYDLLARVEFGLSILLSRYAHLIICNSEAGRAYHIARGYRADRLVVIPNGIDVDKFRPDVNARAEVRSEWNIPSGVYLVGLIGRIDPIKDHPTFLRAASQIAKARPDVRFVCAGPGAGAYNNEMMALSRSLGLDERLLWAGERTDMPRVYNALDLLVSSSRSEGLPNVVAEAMATGVPCVVTDVGDSAQVIGAYGWLCPVGDSRAIAQAVLTGLKSLPVDAVRLRQHICDQYSTSALVQRTAEHLRKLTPERTRHGARGLKAEL